MERDDLLQLSSVTSDRLEAYIYHLQTRDTKREGHPHKPREHAKLSPFTVMIMEDVRAVSISIVRRIVFQVPS